jgi:hypothetical protein
VADSRNLPNADRLSVLAAAILLAYALTRFVDIPLSRLEVQLPGVYLAVEINIRTVVTLIVASLTATGAHWLLKDHPALGSKTTFQHWLVPALTAWVLSVPLYRLPFGLVWLASFAIGGALLMLVLVAEYITVDPNDVRQALATAGLTSVSFALYLILAITLRSTGIRLFLMLPALTIAGGLVSLRTLHLRLRGEWAVLPSVVLALIIAQLTAGLHYWPISPIAFGLAILGPAYALSSLIASLLEGEPLRQAITEPSLVLIVVWGTAIWTR